GLALDHCLCGEVLNDGPDRIHAPFWVFGNRDRLVAMTEPVVDAKAQDLMPVSDAIELLGGHVEIVGGRAGGAHVGAAGGAAHAGRAARTGAHTHASSSRAHTATHARGAGLACGAGDARAGASGARATGGAPRCRRSSDGAPGSGGAHRGAALSAAHVARGGAKAAARHRTG